MGTTVVPARRSPNLWWPAPSADHDPTDEIERRQHVNRSTGWVRANIILPMDTLPDLGSLTIPQLKDLVRDLADHEPLTSYQRRMLRGKVDVVRVELVNRLRSGHDDDDDDEPPGVREPVGPRPPTESGAIAVAPEESDG